MTRRDFEKIAATINKLRAEGMKEEDVALVSRTFVAMLKEENPRFNTERFVDKVLQA